MFVNTVRLSAAVGCAYTSFIFLRAGVAMRHPLLLGLGAACGTGAALLARDSANDFMGELSE